MLYWIVVAVIIAILYLILNPLIVMVKLKLQFGKAVHIVYVPIIGIRSIIKKSFQAKGNAQQWLTDIVTEHPEVKIIVANSVQKSIVIIVDPEYYKPLYLDHDQLEKKDSTGIKEILLSGGLVFAEGNKWKQQRQILGDHFLYEKLKSRIPMINQVVRDKMKFAKVEKCNEFVCSITGDVVIRSFFGEEAEGWKINEREAQIELSDTISSVVQLRGSSWYVYMKQKILGQKSWEYCTKSEKQILQRIDKIKTDIKEIIFKRRDKIKQDGMQANGDFLDLYLNKFMNQNIYSSERIELSEIVSQFATLFVAGTDTTGALTANTLLYLSENKEFETELRQEILTVVGDGDVTSDNINKMLLVDALLKEVLRLRPPIAFPIVREAKQDIQVKDLLISKGQIILLGSQFTNMSSLHYDNPLQFNPKRWLEKSVIKEDNGFINIPFSAGGRNCIGQHMALIEAKIILAHLIRKYETVRNPAVKQAIWPARGVQTFSPSNAVHLLRK